MLQDSEEDGGAGSIAATLVALQSTPKAVEPQNFLKEMNR
jgi:hypothetical protein